MKRAPSEVYWAGIRRFGIFVGEELSIAEYIRFMCANNDQKNTLKNLGNRNDTAEENERDDNDAGKSLYRCFWNIPTYTKNWKDSLTLELTPDEAEFLKEQIINTCDDTLFAYILKNRRNDIARLNSFKELEQFIEQFPESIRNDIKLASSFLDFVYVLRVIIIPTTGLPENRDKVVISDIIKFEDDFYQYISFLLGENFTVGDFKLFSENKEGSALSHRTSTIMPGLYEKMLQTAANEPQKFEEIEFLMKSVSSDVVGEHFEKTYKIFRKAMGLDG